MIPAVPPLVAPGRRTAFALLASLFFAWALANSLNDVLVRHFRSALDLTRAEAGLVQSAFYFGYFIAALPAGWLMRRYGYRSGIVVGLMLYATGALLFWPAAAAGTFGLFLAALTTIALGLACLETAANPFVAVLGDTATGPARLTLAQGFNGLGAVAGPVIGGLFILPAVGIGVDRLAELRSVQQPYALLAACMVVLAVVFSRCRLPNVATDASLASGIRDALRHRHFVAALAAQFAYVAAQVCIWSYFIDFAKEQLPATDTRTIAFLLSSSIGLLMIGRFAGAAVMRKVAAPHALVWCAAANIALCAAAAVSQGAVAVAALWATSLFMSIMFPAIFALGLAGLGPATKIGSSLLIMSIVGGAVVPPLMGAAVDAAGSLGPAMLVPLLCFAVVAAFGARGWRPVHSMDESNYEPA